MFRSVPLPSISIVPPAYDAAVRQRGSAARRPWFEAGLARPLHIREEFLAKSSDACRLLYVSDIHLRRRRGSLLADQVLATVRTSVPRAVLLGGDLVDSPDELPQLGELVRRLRDYAPVFAIGGNHDHRVGLAAVQRAVESGDGVWLQNTTVCIPHGRRQISVTGPDGAGEDEGDVKVLCAHYPSIWRSARRRGFDLVLAGHLHGCQFVAFEARGYLFPGALFYSGCCLRTQCGSSRLVVSRGVSDLIPIRWRCPREVVLCHV